MSKLDSGTLDKLSDITGLDEIPESLLNLVERLQSFVKRGQPHQIATRHDLAMICVIWELATDKKLDRVITLHSGERIDATPEGMLSKEPSMSDIHEDQPVFVRWREKWVECTVHSLYGQGQVHVRVPKDEREFRRVALANVRLKAEAAATT